MPRSRKLPTRDELRAWREFIETTELLRAVLASRLHHDAGLSFGDYAVLLALSEAEDTRLRPTELAEQIGWERSRLSHHLGRMQRRHLVRRDECATDSRGAEIVLEPAGRDAFQAATVPHLSAVKEVFVDALTPHQIAAAAEIAAALRNRLTRTD
ncbi:MarR family transcriptional regulator [Virgisporangium aliadipatigenens]|uniref:MarR family transcriptional regulator n=1 Tax=Virgisporangium aliadipatigenens TaxID=741659 RepID=A0A8J4DVR5_9ACTN|nr:MarR family transcriptional regulator [Virgisporangium aliadipatigenens]GIJ50397.1 MarR family transcriptional regulator [Virgisporangium aliadipatigenens]